MEKELTATCISCKRAREAWRDASCARSSSGIEGAIGGAESVAMAGGGSWGKRQSEVELFR